MPIRCSFLRVTTKYEPFFGLPTLQVFHSRRAFDHAGAHWRYSKRHHTIRVNANGISFLRLLAPQLFADTKPMLVTISG